LEVTTQRVKRNVALDTVFLIKMDIYLTDAAGKDILDYLRQVVKFKDQ
jgi:hypothetical protein